MAGKSRISHHFSGLAAKLSRVGTLNKQRQPFPKTQDEFKRMHGHLYSPWPGKILYVYPKGRSWASEIWWNLCSYCRGAVQTSQFVRHILLLPFATVSINIYHLCSFAAFSCQQFVFGVEFHHNSSTAAQKHSSTKHLWRYLHNSRTFRQPLARAR